MTYHVDGRWRNRIEGNQGFLDEFDTKEKAVRAGRRHAQELEVEHIVRDLNWTIGGRSSSRAP